MQYCINALLKNNNEIMQYYIINNDIALIMHYRALLQMPGAKYAVNNFFRKIFLVCTLGKKNNNNTELYGVSTKAVNLPFSSLTMAFFVGNPK